MLHLSFSSIYKLSSLFCCTGEIDQNMTPSIQQHTMELLTGQTLPQTWHPSSDHRPKAEGRLTTCFLVIPNKEVTTCVSISYVTGALTGINMSVSLYRHDLPPECNHCLIFHFMVRKRKTPPKPQTELSMQGFHAWSAG